MTVLTQNRMELSGDQPSRTASYFPQPQGEQACLHELFESQVDLRGDAVALASGGKSISYAELENRSNRLAHFLRSLDIGPGSFVGLCLERSEIAIIAILACLKSGAAYVPLNPSHPDDRLRFIIFEAEIKTILTEGEQQKRLETFFEGVVVPLDTRAADIATYAPHRLSRFDTGVVPTDICYVLYTSGTTGRPKGVIAEHRNVTHFVSAFNKVCVTTTEDRIFQGFSLSFDGSVEEIWMAFSNGATLVVPDGDAPRFGNELGRYLQRCGVTYFSTVPTLLSTMTEDVPTLQQLVLSGEPCPQELVTRWTKPGRLMLNVYGPTEATVNTTAAILQPGCPVTIGQPINGYKTLILDAEMRPVPPGEKGELYVGGPGISRGYLKQPELTSRSFIRLYKTGDLARTNENGELEFFGRLDSQVKIRGYRVELSEIEALLLEQEEIASAAVRVCERDGDSCLAAFVVLDESVSFFDRDRIYATLKARLPAYMVPAYLDVLDALPMLSTGKVDRKHLPDPATPLLASLIETSTAETLLEERIQRIWADSIKVECIGVEQDFFLDLGGHSLLAAKLVTALRSEGIEIAVRDLYSYPSVRKLATFLENDKPTSQSPGVKGSPRFEGLEPVTRKFGIGAVAVQLTYYLALVPLLSLPLLIIVPPIIEMLYFKRTVLEVIVFLLLVGLCVWPVLILVGIGSKWVIIGRYKPGAYPLWGSYYIRWWLVMRLQSLSGLGIFAGTPLAPMIWRLMGAKIGRNCLLQCRPTSAWDCVTIGDDTSLGFDTQLPAVRIEDGYLLIGNVEVGDRCFVGCHSFLGLDVKMENDSQLDDQSLLADGNSIGAGQSCRGSPAQTTQSIAPAAEPLRRSAALKCAFCVLQMFSLVMLGLILGLPGVLIGFSMAFMVIHASPYLWIPLIATSVPVLILFACCYLAWCKNAVCPAPATGEYRLYSFDYLQFWLLTAVMRIVRGAGWIIFTTIYLPPWMRLMGAKLGKHTEMSTVWSFYPDMLEVGDGVFLADGCVMCASRFHLGRFSVMSSRIGNRTFIGNSALLPAGAEVGNECLIGVLSVPEDPRRRVPDGTDWLGSPSFKLPNRLKVGGFEEKTTYAPTTKLYIQRALVDALRILIPAYLITFLGTTTFIITVGLYHLGGAWAVYALAPVLLWTALVVAVGVTVTIKWSVMGTFKPVVVPLWSRYVWLNEMVAGIYEIVMGPVVTLFYGTPFAAPLLRLLGCKVGKYCYIGSDLFSEFDLVEIGDYVALNDVAVIQTHLFEDRIMKSSHLRIGDGCSVGNMSVVLYDTEMHRGAVLGPLSLLMKGEIMPEHRHWYGIPTIAANDGRRAVASSAQRGFESAVASRVVSL